MNPKVSHPRRILSPSILLLGTAPSENLKPKQKLIPKLGLLTTGTTLAV